MFKTRDASNQKAFTLIELLVVISIIGLLASVILVSLNSARGKSRDTARKQTLRQIQKALELYYDANSSYPVVPCYPGTCGGYSSEPGDVPSNGLGNNGDWIPGLAPTYVGKLPQDPLGGASVIPICSGWKRSYYYKSDGQNFKLIAHCSGETPLGPDDTFYDPIRPNNNGWMVCSGEPACSTW